MVALPRSAVGTATEPVVLCAPVGPYTARVSSLVWALFRQRGLRVTDAFFVARRRGLQYLYSDILDSGRALDDLRRALGPEIVDHHAVDVRVPRAKDGSLVDGDLEPEHAERFRETLWNAARDAIAVAGDRPVIFGLTGGPESAANAQLSGFFPLLARAQDRLVDVRIADPRVDEEMGFFFPEQRDRELFRGHARVDAKKVRVDLVDIELPRLAGVVEGNVLTSWDSALRIARARPQSAPPALVVDLDHGQVTIDGVPLPLSTAERLWYAYLASRRGETRDGWVLAGQEGHAEFFDFLERARASRWTGSIRTKPLLDLLDGVFVPDEDLKNLRGKTVQRVKRWCKKNRPELAALLTPEADGTGHQRIALPAHRIVVRGLSS